jgi:hypothetical protein
MPTPSLILLNMEPCFKRHKNKIMMSVSEDVMCDYIKDIIFR